MTTTTEQIERGSGNVYADLDLPNADEMRVKADLVMRIAHLLRDQGLTQTAAASLLGLSQPKLSGLLRGQFRGVSESKLIECLTRLGQDVEIVVRAAPKSRGEGRVLVTAE
jgi:predicted XRE-type DNA-binding protein